MNWQVHLRRNVSWDALEREQTALISRARDFDEHHLLVSEPHPTFTQGRFSRTRDVLWNDEELTNRGIGVARVARGGQWTYHGPGQIVIYPIATLASLGFTRHAAYRFLALLSTSLQTFLSDHGIPCEQRSRPFGLYAKERKLASFGMCFEGGVSSHGVALYLTTQEEPFRGIHPCGCPGQTPISLQDLGWQLDWPTTAVSLTDHIKKGFKRQ